MNKSPRKKVTGLKPNEKEKLLDLPYCRIPGFGSIFLPSPNSASTIGNTISEPRQTLKKTGNTSSEPRQTDKKTGNTGSEPRQTDKKTGNTSSEPRQTVKITGYTSSEPRQTVKKTGNTVFEAGGNRILITGQNKEA